VGSVASDREVSTPEGHDMFFYIDSNCLQARLARLSSILHQLHFADGTSNHIVHDALDCSNANSMSSEVRLLFVCGR